MMLPTWRSVQIVLAASPLWIMGLLHPLGGALATVVLAGLALALLWDAVSLLTPLPLTFERRDPVHIELGSEAETSIRVRNASKRRVNCSVFQEFDTALSCDTQVVELKLSPGTGADITQKLIPLERGLYHPAPIAVRQRGRFGLLEREYRVAVEGSLKVYPSCDGAYGRLAVQKHRQDRAVRRAPITRLRGEFAGLRDYCPGDDLRDVDWKVSGRQGQLVSRQWQHDAGQHVTVLIDCGRRMADCIGGFSRLDHALNATAQLAATVQYCKDSFSLAAFSNRIECILPLQRGAGILRSTLEHSYTLKPRPVESDYWQVVGHALQRLTKRSLVVLFTDVLDSAASAGMLANISRAAQSHEVVCVVMRDPNLASAVESTDDWKKGAACYLSNQRQKTLATMRKRGITVLEVVPENFSAAVLEEYLRLREVI